MRRRVNPIVFTGLSIRQIQASRPGGRQDEQRACWEGKRRREDRDRGRQKVDASYLTLSSRVVMSSKAIAVNKVPNVLKAITVWREEQSACWDINLGNPLCLFCN